MIAIGTLFSFVSIIAGTLLGAILLTVWLIKRLLFVCPPNEVLIFSGRKHKTADGGKVGFRIVHGGRGLRIPILEKVDRMDMRLISVPMTIVGAYSAGGIPITIHAIANVKISSNRSFLGNAIERFLGHDRREIRRVAKETLEGHLRGVVARMTPEEVNEDRLSFANELEEEAQADLEKLGLQLDTLKIQNVSDDRQYLDSIGRVRIAEIVRAAEVAESDSVRSAEESEAAAEARGAVALSRAQARIAQRTNEMTRIVAELEAKARSEEEISIAAGETARAEAEQKLQTVRAELEALRLEADVTIPAEVHRRVQELHAVGEASTIAESGRAMAEALEAVVGAWADADGEGMDLYVLQNLEHIVEEVAEIAQSLTIKETHLLDGGEGDAVANYASIHATTVRRLFRELEMTLGVDVLGSLRTRVAVGDNGHPQSLPAQQSGLGAAQAHG